MPDKGRYAGPPGYELGHVVDDPICIKTTSCWQSSQCVS